MKKFTKIVSLFVLIGLLFPAIQAKSEDYPRRYLMEGFTGANCGPCAEWWPGIDQYISSHEEVFIPLKYHVAIPTTEPMFEQNPTMNNGRRNYYGVNSVPQLIINGAFFNQTVEMLVDPVVNKKFSPYLITVSQTNTSDKINAIVKVKSNVELSGKKLRVVLVEWKVNYAGTNGETEHHWVARDMLPTIEGTDIAVAANTEQTYNFAFNKKSEYDMHQMYVVAFIQDDATKEVLQAGTNLLDITSKPSITSLNNKTHELIDRNTTIQRTFQLINDGNYPLTFKFNLDTENSIIKSATDVQISLDKTEATLDPGQSANFVATIKVNDQAQYSQFAFVASVATGNLVVDRPKRFYYSTLTKDAKHAVYYWKYTAGNHKTGGEVIYNYLFGINELKKDVVEIPFVGDQDLFKAFPATQFKTAAFMYDFRTFRNILQGSLVKQQISAMLNANKRVLLGNEIGFTFAYTTNDNYPVASEIRNFLNSDLQIKKITYTERATFNSNGSLNAFLPYTVKGVPDDIIGKYTPSTTANTSDNHTIYSENIELNTTVDKYTKPIYTYDDNRIAGVRREMKNGKIVYLAFGINTVSSESDRNTMLKGIYDWLLDDISEEAKLTFEIEKANMDFGDVKVNETKEQKIVLSNTGKKALTITNIESDDPAVFALNLPGLPITLEMGQILEIPVTFSPKAQKDYSESINFESNSYMGGFKSFSVMGKGVGTATLPKISLSSKTINFDTTEVLKSKTKEIQIKNTGAADLKITNIKYKSNDKGVFEVEQIASLPIIINPGDEDKLTVSFMPKEAIPYAASIVLTTNDPEMTTVEIVLNGNGYKKDDGGSVNEPVVSSDGNFSMRTMPNPMSADGFVEIKANNKAVNIELNIVNAAGRVFGNVYTNTQFFGTDKIKLNISDLADGYYILTAVVDGQNYSVPLIIKK